MKVALHMFVILTLIATLSGGLLSAWNDVTAPRIAEHRLRDLKAAISEVLPPYDEYEEITAGKFTMYVGKKKGDESPVGIALRVIGSGFQGKISIMAGVSPDFTTLTGMKVLEQIETPGLGTKIVVDPSKETDQFWFPAQFKGKKLVPGITTIKNKKPSNDSEIQAISGATISSKAVVDILNKEMTKARKLYKER